MDRAKLILVVENDDNDAFFLARAFSGLPDCRAHFCKNAADARMYLEGDGIYAERSKYPFPSAVISDLNLGSETGLDFCRWMQGQSKFAHLPTVLMSGALATTAMLEAAGAEGVQVVLKSADVRELKDIVIQLRDRAIGGFMQESTD
jgi:CheY-like chemotaxis protein